MTALPNPWISDSAVSKPSIADAAVAPNQHPRAQGVTAGPFDDDNDDHRFRLDELAFMEAIEERPLFLRRAYMR